MGSGNRDGRRRRVLNEGARTAAEAATASSAEPGANESTPKRRFTPPPESPSFAVARGVLPATGLGLAGVVAAGLAASGLVIAGGHFRGALPAALAPLLDPNAVASLSAWLGAALLLTLGGLCGVIYGLRSNRSDDVRGLYRWWLTAAVACVLGSAVYAVDGAGLLAGSLSSATGVALLGGEGWWMLAVGLIAPVLCFRLVGDLIESRVASVLAGLSVVCIGAAWAAAAGAPLVADKPHGELIRSGGILVGLVLLIGAQLGYVRRVVLETDGVAAAPQPKPHRAKQKPAKPAEDATAAKPAVALRAAPEPVVEKTVEPKAPQTPAAEGKSRRAARKQEPAVRQAQAAPKTQWTDGSEGDADYEDDGPRRKLSKAERKRLRKAKANGRYAA